LLDDGAGRRELGRRAAAVVREHFDLGDTVAALLGTLARGTLERGRA
jgi:hypothetical protein